MKIIGWLVIFLLGLSIINLVAYRIKVIAKIGFSFPMGMGINSFIMFSLDLFNIPINQINLILGIETIIILLSLTGFYLINKSTITKGSFFTKIDFKKAFNINLAWIFLFSYAIYLVYVITAKAMFWPPFIFDSIDGYDFLAKVIVKEGTLNNSIFNPDYLLSSIRSLYPPLVPLNFAFAYLLGFDSSQIVVALFFVSLFISFYAMLTKHTTPLAGALFSLLLIITPEFAAFSCLSSSNPPCTFYCGIGMICLYTYYHFKEKPYLYIGILFIMLAIWTRTEAVLFTVAGSLYLITKPFHKKQLLSLVLFGFCSMVAFLSWQIYMKSVLNIESSLPIVKKLFWDPEKLSRMWSQVTFVTFSTQFYGIIVYLFILMALANIVFIIKKKENGILLGTILLAWVTYIYFYYQIDADYVDLSMGGWIHSGYKRGLFYFLPLILFYCANNFISDKLFKKYFTV